MAVAAQTCARRAQDLKADQSRYRDPEAGGATSRQRLAEMKQRGERDAGNDGDSGQWHSASYMTLSTLRAADELNRHKGRLLPERHPEATVELYHKALSIAEE